MRQCSMCEKSSMKANTRIKLRGKYNPTNSSRKKANLQYAVDPKTGKRLLVCTKCLRTLSKTKKK